MNKKEFTNICWMIMEKGILVIGFFWLQLMLLNIWALQWLEIFLIFMQYIKYYR